MEHQIIKVALFQYIRQLERKKNAEPNPTIQEIIQKDIDTAKAININVWEKKKGA